MLLKQFRNLSPLLAAALLLVSFTTRVSATRGSSTRFNMKALSPYSKIGHESRRHLQSCNVVKVLNDAEYCLDSPVCSNELPTGACPTKGTRSWNLCRKHLASYNETARFCYAPEDAICVASKGSFQCEFPSSSSGGSITPTTAAPTPSPPATGGGKKFHILTYNDVYELEQVMSNGFGEGGASRVSKYIQYFRTRHEEGSTLVLFPGDTMSPSLWSRIFHGLQMITAHNLFKLDFASLGNHEFDMGLDAFYKVAQESNFPWLNANCYEISSNSLLPHTIPHAIKSVNGVKVGVFGIMYSLNDNTTGAYWTDPILAAEVQVSQLRAKGAEFIIAMTHQDWEDDNIFSKSVEGIDLMVGGHDHKAMMNTEFGIPYVKADMDFKSIWTIDVTTYAKSPATFRSALRASSGTAYHSSFRFVREPIVSSMATDPVMDAEIEKLRVLADKEFGAVIGRSDVVLDSRQAIVRSRESALANLLTDAFKSAYPADMAVLNGGGIRGDKIVEPGNLTRGDVISWCPFGNYIYSVSISGLALHKLIEASASLSCTGKDLLKSNGFLLHPSGFRYNFQCIADGMGRVRSLVQDVEGLPIIADDDVFTLNIVSFIYHYFEEVMVKYGVKLLKDDKNSVTDDVVIISYVEELEILSPQEEGRFFVKS